ncbi:MAG: glycosyltransferase family 1 protein [Microcoleus sp. CAN_BIN18]|nr:glycosyltransferase family 1 protein [Microcoleus sp. CAN_BIN18]
MHCKDLTNIKESNQASTKQRPIRILHVVGGMNRGGIETWLMHVLRHIDRDRFHMDFLVHTEKPCPYDDEARTLGSKIIPCLDPSKPWLYARNFKRILSEYGPYDIVHSHVHHFSGYVLYLAKQAGIPVRIAHSHNDTSSAEANAGWLRRSYLTLTEWSIAKFATIGLGCSRNAAASLFGSSYQTDPRWQLLYYGIDLTPFRESVDAVAVRTELDIPVDAFVVGHVGRFDRQKNHEFLLEIAAEIAKREPKMRLLLIGDGSLKLDIEQKAIEMGLGDYVIFAGLRSDIPRLMLGAIDTFVLPSLYEGLGLVLIEAQAADLPCVFSDVVPEEADVIKPLVQRNSLSKSPLVWAETILAARRDTTSDLSQTDALDIVEKSPFNITFGLKKLVEVYEANFSAASS